MASVFRRCAPPPTRLLLSVGIGGYTKVACRPVNAHICEMEKRLQVSREEVKDLKPKQLHFLDINSGIYVKK